MTVGALVVALVVGLVLLRDAPTWAVLAFVAGWLIVWALLLAQRIRAEK